MTSKLHLKSHFLTSLFDYCLSCHHVLLTLGLPDQTDLMNM